MRSKIRQVSAKQALRIKEYRKAKKEFMDKLEDKTCPVMREIFGKYVPVTEIHHMEGKIGDLLTDKDNFLAVSREGHVWIDKHPLKAYKMGWCRKRNRKN